MDRGRKGRRDRGTDRGREGGVDRGWGGVGREYVTIQQVASFATATALSLCCMRQG